MKSTKYQIFVLFLLLLTACGNNKAVERYELKPYTDPGGLFTMTAPAGWQTDYDPQTKMVTFTAPNPENSAYSLTVRVLAVKTQSDSWDASGEETRQVIEGLLQSFFPDESPEIYTTNDFTIAKEPAIMMDFAQVIDGGGYYKGSIVLAAMRGYAIGFVGGAEEATWDAFLPAFKLMLLDFELTQ